MALPFPSSSGGSRGPNLGPEQKADGAPHDGASAGRYFGNDNPSVSVPGGQPMSTNGFSPEAGNPALPRNPMDGYGKPPTGIRR